MTTSRYVIGRRLLGALGFAAICVLPGIRPAAAQPTAVKPTLLVFPFDRSEVIDPSIADTISAAVRNRLKASAKYEYMTYNTRSALVQRAIQSGSIARDVAEGPFQDEQGANIARTLGLDFALTGTVDDASVDVVSNTATVTVTAQLVNARDGNPVQTAAVSGTAAEAGVAGDALLRRAADDAAGKLVSQLFAGAERAEATAVKPLDNGTPTPPVVRNDTAPAGLPTGTIPVESKTRKKSNNMLLIGGIALLGIIIAASGGGGGGGGGGGNGGGGNPPPFPL